MCSVHKIFHFLPEAKWPFVDTLVNVHWSKWILKQVLYQIPATVRVRGVVFALNHCTAMHTWGGHNMVNDLQIYSLSRQLLQSANVSFLIGEQLWVLFLHLKCYEFKFSWVITVIYSRLGFSRRLKGWGQEVHLLEVTPFSWLITRWKVDFGS